MKATIPISRHVGGKVQTVGVSVTVRFPGDLWRLLVARAKSAKVNPELLIREILREHLEAQ